MIWLCGLWSSCIDAHSFSYLVIDYEIIKIISHNYFTWIRQLSDSAFNSLHGKFHLLIYTPLTMCCRISASIFLVRFWRQWWDRSDGAEESADQAEAEIERGQSRADHEVIRLGWYTIYARIHVCIKNFMCSHEMQSKTNDMFPQQSTHELPKSRIIFVRLNFLFYVHIIISSVQTNILEFEIAYITRFIRNHEKAILWGDPDPRLLGSLNLQIII